VLDVDGVLLIGGRPVPGSLDLVRTLRRRRFPVSLLTNDGNNSIAEKRRFLHRCGFDFEEREITSCSDGLVELAQSRGLRGKLFFVVGDLGKPNYATKAGLRYTRDLARLPPCEGVIMGESHYRWEPVLNGVVNFFLRFPERLFIVPNPDECYPKKKGRVAVAAGGTARFVQHVTAAYGVDVQPIYLGKPYSPIFEHNHHLLERRLRRRIRRERVVMVGDSLASDVRGAAGFGYRSALVLTGITDPAGLRTSPIRPDLVFQGF
jgi:NagD protein